MVYARDCPKPVQGGCDLFCGIVYKKIVEIVHLPSSVAMIGPYMASTKSNVPTQLKSSQITGRVDALCGSSGKNPVLNDEVTGSIPESGQMIA